MSRLFSRSMRRCGSWICRHLARYLKFMIYLCLVCLALFLIRTSYININRPQLKYFAKEIMILQSRRKLPRLFRVDKRKLEGSEARLSAAYQDRRKSSNYKSHEDGDEISYIKTVAAILNRSSENSKIYDRHHGTLFKSSKSRKPMLCNNVHTFYYPWYGNPKFNNHYLHWNHRYLPHWNPEVAKVYPRGVHVPPNDIGANFYPELGAYSSSDPVLIKQHMQQLSFAGIGVIVLSYYPPGQADDNGEDWQSLFSELLEQAHNYNIKVAFHIEPYKMRTEMSVKNDLKHIINSYSHYPAFYRLTHENKTMPLVYVYDSYLISALNWAKILKRGSESIRGSKYDSFVIGLLVSQDDDMVIKAAGFDGFYTYFASDGFTYGSTRANWDQLRSFAASNNLLFIPSVGPGYIDTRVRPWNEDNIRKRVNGRYYAEGWKNALKVKPQIISITSFNEWHEGTQIEKAVPKKIEHYTYSDYKPYNPDYYLVMTKKLLKSFENCS